MVKKQSVGWVKASGWLFVLGIIISIIAGLAYPMYQTQITMVLAIIGFIIGLLGIAGVGGIEKTDINKFLLAVVALMAAGGAGNAFSRIPEPIGSYLVAIVNYVGALVVPAAVLIALKSIWKAGSTKF
jgi:hypothetical protein